MISIIPLGFTTPSDNEPPDARSLIGDFCFASQARIAGDGCSVYQVDNLAVPLFVLFAKPPRLPSPPSCAPKKGDGKFLKLSIVGLS